MAELRAMVTQLAEQNRQLLAAAAGAAATQATTAPPEAQISPAVPMASPPATPSTGPARTTTPQSQPDATTVTGHFYGRTVISGDALVMQGNMYNGKTEPAGAKKHWYQETIMDAGNRANLIQGSAAESTIKGLGFFDRPRTVATTPRQESSKGRTRQRKRSSQYPEEI